MKMSFTLADTSRYVEWCQRCGSFRRSVWDTWRAPEQRRERAQDLPDVHLVPLAEYAALLDVVEAARKVARGRIPAVSAELEGSTWKHSRISDGLTDALREALGALDRETSTDCASPTNEEENGQHEKHGTRGVRRVSGGGAVAPPVGQPAGEGAAALGGDGAGSVQSGGVVERADRVAADSSSAATSDEHGLIEAVDAFVAEQEYLLDSYEDGTKIPGEWARTYRAMKKALKRARTAKDQPKGGQRT
jgi:hypothetical protein